MKALLLPAAAALAWAAGAAAGAAAYAPAYPPPYEIRVPAEGAAGDMFSLALGARRLFADVWFVRLMQYYGSHEEGPDGEEECPEHPGELHHHHHHGLNGEGVYPEFLPRARHVLELDPHFAAAGLYGAGSLAFNLGRPEEAQQLLDFAIRNSPREWKYPMLLAAIGYSASKEPLKVAEALRPFLREPDCPAMLKQLAAFLNKKAGNYAAAAAIYADIAATSRDEFYVRNARRELERLASVNNIK